MNLRNLDSTLVFFVLIFVLFWFWFPCFVVTHLSTSSNWQTEVQDKTLLAWSWHVLCTVESLDLAMLDDHPSPRTCGQGAPARWAEGVGEGRTACSGPRPLPSPAIGGGLALRWPSWLGPPWPSVLEHPHQSLLAIIATCSHRALSRQNGFPLSSRSWRPS